MKALGLGSGAGEDCEPEERKEKRHFSRSGGRRRRRRTACGGSVGAVGGVSPDSLIYYSSDNHSGSRAGIVGAAGALFTSSATTSLAGDRCSFGSDHDVLVLPLAGRERPGCALGPEPDFAAQETSSSPFASQNQRHSNRPPNPSKGLEEGSTQREADQQVVAEEEEEALDPTKYSFSKALKECQNQKNKSEAPCLPSRKPRRPRPASVDFIGQGADVSILSPRFLVDGVAGMKKGSATSSRSRSGTFPSPGTPSYRRGAGAAAYQKGWSSERVPLPKYGNRRYAGSRVFVPFNNGRTLPSKWEDAEKWILSPVSGDGFGRSSVPPSHHRRPKSKSGPLGTQVIGGAYSSVSPLVPCFDSGRVGNLTANSPFLAGVLMPERGCCVNGNGGKGVVGTGRGVEANGAGGRLYPMNEEPYIARSASIHGWSDTPVESSSSLPSSRDEKSEGTREAASAISPSIIKKDAATQMSPEGSTLSSPKDRSSFSRSPQSTHPIGQESQFSKLEVRDVQVDDRVTVTRWSKKHIARSSDGRSANITEWKKKSVDAETSWEVAESKSISKYKREEAKITAWENLQKAKAEAEIRKLEMKLEKKRSSSMDKILSKLRSAQKKAQDMRSVVNDKQTNQVLKTPRKVSYFCKTGHISSLSGCFTCHAF